MNADTKEIVDKIKELSSGISKELIDMAQRVN